MRSRGGSSPIPNHEQLFLFEHELRSHTENTAKQENVKSLSILRAQLLSRTWIQQADTGLVWVHVLDRLWPCGETWEGLEFVWELESWWDGGEEELQLLVKK